jgi:coiled-coil and C2 domain-containing protein 2A
MREVIFPGPIPLKESETIKENILRCESNNSIGDVNLNDVDFPNKTRFIKRVRAYQLLRKAQLLKPKHVGKKLSNIDQFVIEAEFIIEAWPELLLEYIFQQRRPLNPYRINRSDNATASPQQCSILVQVTSASNLPERKMLQNGKPNEIRPFVEIGFQKRKCRTDTRLGQNPHWNEMVRLKIMNEDFDPQYLMDSDITSEMIYINLFDEVVIDILEDQRTSDQFVHERIEKVWLGSLVIPFSAVWERRCRVVGTFPIEIPQSLQQYIQKIDVTTGKIIPSCIHLFITLDPQLLQPSSIDVQFETEEETKLIKHSEQWLASLASYNRNILALSQNMSGKTVFIPRFIRPQQPPKSFTTITKVLRFVSVVPFLANTTGFGAHCDLWSTSDQILHVGSADSVEHAILLCNFMLARNINAWVVLGDDLIIGKSAYVLVENNEQETIIKPELNTTIWSSLNSLKLLPNIDLKRSSSWLFPANKKNSNISNSKFELYNPVTGKIYETNERLCPLHKIGCIFNAENVLS